MRQCVGYLEYHGKRLKYYVFGNRNEGFGVEITETRIEKADHVVSNSFEKALDLAKKLRNGSVFPANLCEILEDYQFGNGTD
ncbi:MAG TPA: DUF6514 family protein [Caproiciproducens sp.]|nr:DUF6514 family protein [Caproiciproducens sp.]